MLKHLKVEELRPGMMVTQVIEQHGPVKIRKVGFIRSKDMIRGLTEMGVTVLEVDIAQSLNVEPEDDDIDPQSAEQNTGASNKTPKPTATQRLVASNRQIADVDRQLSQQFHRSLFLPAVDQMPSKWRLYGKPYALLFVVIIAGLVGGAMASYTILGFMNAPVQQTASDLNTIGENILSNTASLNTAPLNTASSNTAPSNSEGAQKASTQGAKDVPADLLKQQSQVEPEIDNAKAATLTNSDANEAQQNSDNEAKNTQQVRASNDESGERSGEKASQNKPVSKTQSDTVSPSTSVNKSAPETINGVVLEAGQKILGYQSGVDDEDQASNSSSSSSSSASSVLQNQNASARGNSSNTASQDVRPQERLNSTLLRRIQAAADDVDSQMSLPPSQEPLRVTDLNELPRIDQLSPAVLTKMPAMSFSAHMYASNPRDRWVRVNSKRLGEGDTIADDVILKRIESEKVVLEYEGVEFTMNALSDW